MRKFFAIFGIVLAFSADSNAQTDTYTAWLASFNTFKLNQKWSIHLDVQLRSTDEYQQIQTLLFRPGINFHIHKNQIISAGYAYIPNRVLSDEDEEMLAEHRLWQQYIILQPVAHTAVQHRFRFEERFIPVPAVRNGDLYADDEQFSTRLRYFVRSVIPLKKQSSAFSKGTFLAAQNEIFFNTSHQDHVNGKFFDQNRLYGAIGYRFSKGFDAEAGYMWQLVERKEGWNNLNNHIFQVAIYWRR